MSPFLYLCRFISHLFTVFTLLFLCALYLLTINPSWLQDLLSYIVFQLTTRALYLPTYKIHNTGLQSSTKFQPLADIETLGHGSQELRPSSGRLRLWCHAPLNPKKDCLIELSEVTDSCQIFVLSKINRSRKYICKQNKHKTRAEKKSVIVKITSFARAAKTRPAAHFYQVERPGEKRVSACAFPDDI